VLEVLLQSSAFEEILCDGLKPHDKQFIRMGKSNLLQESV